jgi:hypothetical protein
VRVDLNNESRKLILTSRFDSRHCVLNLTIEAQVILKNELLRPLTLRCGEELIRVPASETAAAPLLKPGPGSVKVLFAIDGSSFGRQTEIKMDNGSISEIPIENSPSVAVEAWHKPYKPQAVLTFFAPAIIINNSNLELVGIHPNGEFRLRPSEHELWSHPAFFKSPKGGQSRPVPLLLRTADFPSRAEVPIECGIPHVQDNLMLPFVEGGGLYVPLRYTIGSHKSHSSIVTILPKLFLENFTNEDVLLQAVNEDDWPVGDFIITPPQTTQQLNWSSASFVYMYGTPGCKGTLLMLFGLEIHTTFQMAGRCPLELLIRYVSGGSSIVTFRPVILPQPLMISNSLLEPIGYRQVGSESLIEVPPMATTFVFYSKPFDDSNLLVTVGDETVLVNVSRLHEPVFLTSRLTACIELANAVDDSRIVVVSDPQIAFSSPPKFEANFELSSFGISVIDDSLREIALLTMNSVEVEVQNSDTFTVDFSLKSFQIDDLNPLALMNVAVGGYPQSDADSVIRLHANLYQNAPLFTAFKELVLRVEPVVILADSSFISDLLYLLSKSKLSHVQTKQMKERVPFTADTLEIGELTAAVFVRPQTRRPWVYHPRPNRLRFIPDVTNGQITIPPSAYSDCMMTRSYVSEEILKPLIKSVQSQSMKLFFKTNVFCPLTGTGKSKFANQAKRLRQGEIKALGRIGGTVLFHGGEAI